MTVRSLVGVATLVISAVSAATSSAYAQDTVAGVGEAARHAREGFWIGFGFGAGSLGCEGCDDRETGFSGYLKLGSTINPHVLLGAETNGWVKSEDGVNFMHGNLSAVAYLYPSVTNGFYLKGGLGVATNRIEAGDFGTASERGPGAVLGIGYDIRIRNNLSLTPYANALGGKFDSGNTNLIQLGLGFTWH